MRVAVEMSQCGQLQPVKALCSERAVSVCGDIRNLVLYRNCFGYHLYVACLRFSAVNIEVSTKGRVTC